MSSFTAIVREDNGFGTIVTITTVTLNELTEGVSFTCPSPTNQSAPARMWVGETLITNSLGFDPAPYHTGFMLRLFMYMRDDQEGCLAVNGAVYDPEITIVAASCDHTFGAIPDLLGSPTGHIDCGPDPGGATCTIYSAVPLDVAFLDGTAWLSWINNGLGFACDSVSGPNFIVRDVRVTA